MIELLDLEKHPDGCIGFAPREKREQLEVKMLARLVFIEHGRPKRAWVRIWGVTTINGRAIDYTGELIDDTLLELEVGATVPFEPQHVCEWDVPARLGRVHGLVVRR